MTKFILTSESTIDLPFSYVEQRNIDVLLYSYFVNGEEYFDDMGRNENSLKEFYERLDRDLPTTSQPNVGRYFSFFEEQVKKANGKDILHVVFGTGMTQSYNSAILAKKMIADKYPEQRLELIDSLCSSSGFGMLVDTIADLRDEGATIEEAISWAEGNKLKIQHNVYTTTLEYLKRSGRLTGISAMIGSVLKICPLIKLDNKGKLVAYSKVRGKKKAMLETVANMIELAEDGVNYSGKCYICHSNCIDDAIELKDEVEKNFPNLVGKIKIFDIGTIIASHTGPGTVSIFYFGKEREEIIV